MEETIFLCLFDRPLSAVTGLNQIGNCVDRLRYFFPRLSEARLYGQRLFGDEKRYHAILGIGPDSVTFFMYDFDEIYDAGSVLSFEQSRDPGQFPALFTSVLKNYFGRKICPRESEEISVHGSQVLVFDHSRYVSPQIIECRKIMRAAAKEQNKKVRFTLVPQERFEEPQAIEFNPRAVPLDDRL